MKKLKNVSADVNLRSIQRQILFQDHSYALVVNVDIIEVSEMEASKRQRWWESLNYEAQELLWMTEKLMERFQNTKEEPTEYNREIFMLLSESKRKLDEINVLMTMPKLEGE